MENKDQLRDMALGKWLSFKMMLVAISMVHISMVLWVLRLFI